MNKIKKTVSILIFCMSFIVSCTKGDVKMDTNVIFAKGVKAPSEIFSNSVWVNMLVTDEEKNYDTQVYSVNFEPSGRTYWHSHPGGQILLVTKGTGYYQEKGKPARLLKKGDVVTIAPNTIHWHGASSHEEFTHIGISTKVHEGAAKWLGAVRDQDYHEAQK